MEVETWTIRAALPPEKVGNRSSYASNRIDPSFQHRVWEKRLFNELDDHLDVLEPHASLSALNVKLQINLLSRYIILRALNTDLNALVARHLAYVHSQRTLRTPGLWLCNLKRTQTGSASIWHHRQHWRNLVKRGWACGRKLGLGNLNSCRRCGRRGGHRWDGRFRLASRRRLGDRSQTKNEIAFNEVFECHPLLIFPTFDCAHNLAMLKFQDLLKQRLAEAIRCQKILISDAKGIQNCSLT